MTGLPKDVQQLLWFGDKDRLKEALPELKKRLTRYQSFELCTISINEFNRHRPPDEHQDVVRLLIKEFNVNPHSPIPDEDPKVVPLTLLQKACWQARGSGMIPFLITEYGCRADQYCLVLWFSVIYCPVEEMRMLLENGGCPWTHLPTKEGGIALHHISTMEMALYLIETVCSNNAEAHRMVNAKNFDGDTPLFLLRKRGWRYDAEVIKYLEDLANSLPRPFAMPDNDGESTSSPSYRFNPALRGKQLRMAKEIFDILESAFIPSLCYNILGYVAPVDIL